MSTQLQDSLSIPTSTDISTDIDTELPDNISRRRFLITSIASGAGLTLGMYLSGCERNPDSTLDSKNDSTQEATKATPLPGAAEESALSDKPVLLFEPNAFIRIDSANKVTVIIKHLEMGQGTYTGLATLVAEELDAAWEQIRVESAPADASKYNNLFWGPRQGTGGSTAMANSFTQMRKAGATARYMLVAAAAKKWQVPVDQITVDSGMLEHAASGKSTTFADIAALAANEVVPEEVFLKDPEDYKLIGKPLQRMDSRDKVFAKAIFTQDVKLPGLLTAAVARPPRFGALVKSVDGSQAKTVKGVAAVVSFDGGVAVLADNYWSALQGINKLKIEWDESKAFMLSSSDILADYRKLAENPGAIARQDGDVEKALKGAKQTLSADFEFPYLAHATMEPLNCVVRINSQGCEIWNGDQSQTADQHAVAKLLGLQPMQVKINTLYAGGSFGRRGNPLSDYVLEAVKITKAYGKDNVPVKMIWSRENDMQAGYYRPMYFHRIRAGVDKKGKPVAWSQRIVGQSILSVFGEGMIKDGIDPTSVEGASNMPYAIPNLRVDLHSPKLPVPVQWWRSVGSTHTAFSVETMIDALAALTQQDPVQYRRSLLEKEPRHLAVLNLAAEKSGWGTVLPANRARGVALHKSFNTYVAHVAEVSLNDDNSYRVDKVVIAVDCGLPVNPDVIKAQMEGGMGFGLATVFSSEITFNKGVAEQSNFHDYVVLRMNQMPEVEVFIVPSTESPTGVGEPSTPVIAPAVANALSTLTGKRYFHLPIKHV